MTTTTASTIETASAVVVENKNETNNIIENNLKNKEYIVYNKMSDMNELKIGDTIKFAYTTKKSTDLYDGSVVEKISKKTIALEGGGVFKIANITDLEIFQEEEEQEEEEQDEEQQHKEQMELYGYSTCSVCEKDLEKSQIGDDGVCISCSQIEEEEEEEEEEDEEEDEEEQEEEEEEDEEEAILMKKLADIRKKKLHKKQQEEDEEREEAFQEYSRDKNTIEKYRAYYADKIKKYADKIGCPREIINMGVDTYIDGDWEDKFREDFRTKHLDQMRKEYFKGSSGARGEKVSEGKRQAPTDKGRKMENLFDKGQTIKHTATEKGTKLGETIGKVSDDYKFVVGETTFDTLNQFICYSNKKYNPKKVQKESAWCGCVSKKVEGEYVKVK